MLSIAKSNDFCIVSGSKKFTSNWVYTILIIAETRETPKPIFIASVKERYPSLAFLKTINDASCFGVEIFFEIFKFLSKA